MDFAAFPELGLWFADHAEWVMWALLALYVADKVAKHTPTTKDDDIVDTIKRVLTDIGVRLPWRK